jgi:hypothetical protein
MSGQRSLHSSRAEGGPPPRLPASGGQPTLRGCGGCQAGRPQRPAHTMKECPACAPTLKGVLGRACDAASALPLVSLRGASEPVRARGGQDQAVERVHFSQVLEGETQTQTQERGIERCCARAHGHTRGGGAPNRVLCEGNRQRAIRSAHLPAAGPRRLEAGSWRHWLWLAEQPRRPGGRQRGLFEKRQARAGAPHADCWHGAVCHLPRGARG